MTDAHSLVDGFATCVRSYPDRVAVRFDGKALTYAELPRGVGVVLLDRDVPGACATRPSRPPRHGWAGYVVYTSASTGSAKGVLIGHRSVLDRFRDVTGQFGLTSRDINLQVISLGFEVPVREICAPLAVGGAVALLPPDGERDPGIVVETIRRARLTVIVCAVHIPVGRPLSNTRVHVLDTWLNPVLIGATGEVRLSGGRVGRGYVSRPGPVSRSPKRSWCAMARSSGAAHICGCGRRRATE